MNGLPCLWLYVDNKNNILMSSTVQLALPTENNSGLLAKYQS